MAIADVQPDKVGNFANDLPFDIGELLKIADKLNGILYKKRMASEDMFQQTLQIVGKTLRPYVTARGIDWSPRNDWIKDLQKDIKKSYGSWKDNKEWFKDNILIPFMARMLRDHGIDTQQLPNDVTIQSLDVAIEDSGVGKEKPIAKALDLSEGNTLIYIGIAAAIGIMIWRG